MLNNYQLLATVYILLDNWAESENLRIIPYEIITKICKTNPISKKPK